MGAIAQLAERHNGIVKVRRSIRLSSTRFMGKRFYKKLTHDKVCKEYAEYMWDRYKRYVMAENITKKEFVTREYKSAKNINRDKMHEWCVLYFG